jgi:hypothetical protein
LLPGSATCKAMLAITGDVYEVSVLDPRIVTVEQEILAPLV